MNPGTLGVMALKLYYHISRTIDRAESGEKRYFIHSHELVPFKRIKSRNMSLMGSHLHFTQHRKLAISRRKSRVIWSDEFILGKYNKNINGL